MPKQKETRCIWCGSRQHHPDRCPKAPGVIATPESPAPPGSLRCDGVVGLRPWKGEKHGMCNRTACANKNALWFNGSTRKYYCQPCALKIMAWPENAGLLTKEEPEPNNRSLP